MSLYFVGADALFGRYWGTMQEIPGLHFETAYYQGIEFCIEHGLQRFESGAQGEHKIARGFEPVRTCSFHHIVHQGFRAAIADYLQREADWVDDYHGEIARHEPFRIVSQS
jgi:predicted N-acyltransferase